MALAMIEIDPIVHNKEYTLVKIIGKGTYSTVYLSQYTTYETIDTP
jgi:hypothetical protein